MAKVCLTHGTKKKKTISRALTQFWSRPQSVHVMQPSFIDKKRTGAMVFYFESGQTMLNCHKANNRVSKPQMVWKGMF